MIQLSNKLLNSPLSEKVAITQDIINSDKLMTQCIPSNQNSLLTQNSSLEKILKQTENWEKNKMKIHRRSKQIQEGRNYKCECGKSYFSYSALNNHIKIKHNERFIKRTRGRPLKYPKKEKYDFEKTSYYNFFIENGRAPEKEKSFDVLSLIQRAFAFIYTSTTSNKLFSKANTFDDIPILSNLVSRNVIFDKPKNEKICDEIFTEYLADFMNKTNEKYFLFMIKFILLFREFYDLSENKHKKEDEKKAVTNVLSPHKLPDLSNEFYCYFMETNDFFGMNVDEKNEIVEIIQHFCTWLFKNDYTQLKLSLAS